MKLDITITISISISIPNGSYQSCQFAMSDCTLALGRYLMTKLPLALAA